LRTDLLALAGIEELQIEVAKEDMNDPYSMDVLNLYVAPKAAVNSDHTSMIHEVASITKKSTEITPNVVIIAFEELLDKAGGMKFMEIFDARPKPA
jgi:phosphopantetheine adenylyltransferase